MRFRGDPDGREKNYDDVEAEYRSQKLGLQNREVEACDDYVCKSTKSTRG